MHPQLTCVHHHRKSIVADYQISERVRLGTVKLGVTHSPTSPQLQPIVPATPTSTRLHTT